MTTNGEWLFSKPFEEQVAWTNAEHQDGTLDGDTAALNARIAELTAERDKLQEQLRIGWECECRLQAEREQYRKLFGMALDWAHEITMLETSIDEGMA